jgi:geranylgeranyl pyrophosphate synthase
MRHAIFAGGKRLRPLLAIACYESAEGFESKIYPVAAALEMLHTYSLIHDDLPCMDDDDQRRGQPTVHVAFDEATAVLAGDALHALAFEVLTEFAPLVVTREVVHAIGTTGMLGGQMADLQAEGAAPTEDLVAGIHRRKTGALIIASARAGALMAEASLATTNAVTNYARPLGLAFQIVDDLLEVGGDAQRLGKPAASDQKHQKVTYPGAVGIDTARAKVRSLTVEAIAALEDIPGDTTILRALAEFIESRDH